MVKSPFIIDVSETDFEYEVIQYSHEIPVVVDFWADWCVPCKTLDPILRELARERHGEFRLAKVNVDENQNLAMRFNVRGIPVVKGFRQGVVVSEFSGAQLEDQVRKFLIDLVPSFTDLQIDKGFSLIQLEDWDSAMETFRQILEERPNQSKALLGFAKCLVVQGAGAEVLQILDHFPASKEFGAAQQLRPLASALSQIEAGLPEVDDPFEAMYLRALHLIGRRKIPAALDGLLEVLRQDKRYRNGEAHKVILGLFEILGNDNPTTREYRTELASILF
jgi:putative thioredoxin